VGTWGPSVTAPPGGLLARTLPGGPNRPNGYPVARSGYTTRKLGSNSLSMGSR